MKRLHSYLCIFTALTTFISCSEEVDFSQLDDLEVAPSFETSIFYVKVQEGLINRVSGISFFTQDFNFDAFQEPVFANKVIEGVITYELENTTSKDIELRLDFLDDQDTVLDTELFAMNKAPSTTTIREVKYGNTGKSLDVIKNTSNIRFSANNLGDNTTVSSLRDPAIIIKSSANFTIEVK